MKLILFLTNSNSYFILRHGLLGHEEDDTGQCKSSITEKFEKNNNSTGILKELMAGPIIHVTLAASSRSDTITLLKMKECGTQTQQAAWSTIVVMPPPLPSIALSLHS